MSEQGSRTVNLDERRAAAAAVIDELIDRWRNQPPDDEYPSPTPAALDKLASMKGCFCGGVDVVQDADGGIVVSIGKRNSSGSLHIGDDGGVVLMGFDDTGLSFWWEIP